jgi:hypothetical protein
MRLGRREILKALGLGALGVLASSELAAAGDLHQGYLFDVRVLEFNGGAERISSITDRQSFVFRKELKKWVNGLLKAEVENDPVLRGVAIREPFPPAPWIPGVLELGLNVVVDKTDRGFYAAAITSTYKRVKLQNRERLNDKTNPLTSSDFVEVRQVSLPIPFVVEAAQATHPERLAAAIFQRYRVELTLDLKEISHIKSEHE